MPAPLKPLRGLFLAILLIAAAKGHAQPAPLADAAPPAELALAESEHINHVAYGRYAEALPFARRVFELQRHRLGPDDSDTLVAASNLAETYMALGRYSEAESLVIDALDSAERQFGRESGFTRTFAEQLAKLYRDQGRYAEAEQVYRRAIETYVQVRGRSSRAALLAMYDLASLFHNHGRQEEAVSLLREALDNSERDHGPDARNTLESAARLADLYRADGNLGEAEPLARRAFEGFEALNDPTDVSLLESLSTLAKVYQARGRYGEAEPLLRRALDGYRQNLGPSHPDALAAIDRLAGLFIAAGRPGDAEPLLLQALSARERVLGRDAPDTLAGYENLLLLSHGSDRSGRTILDLASRFLAALRDRRNGGTGQRARAQREREEGTSAARFALFADVAWNSTESAADQRDAALGEAFAALQDSIAGAADRAVAEQAARRYAGGLDPMLTGLIRERQQRQDEWAAFDSRLAIVFGEDPEATSDRPVVIRQELERVQARITAIDAQLTARAPEYFTLIRPQPLAIDAARALLGEREAILLAVPSRFGTHVMAVTRDGIRWHRSNWTVAQVQRAVRRLRWDAGASVSGTEAELAELRDLPIVGRPSFDRATAFALYRELIAPVATHLQGRRQLYVAAGGALAGLPFQLLVSAPPQGADNDPAALRSTHWFGEEAALVHIPSLQSLALLRQRSGAAVGDAFTGIGDPLLAGQPQARNRNAGRGLPASAQLFRAGRSRDGGLIADVSTLRRLARLPGTARELQAVRRTLRARRSSLLLADRATEPNLRSLDLSRSRIILFSTHGLTAEESSRVGLGESGLVLTPPAEATDGDDGFLAASEVTTLRLDADWAILSACNTATGDGASAAGLGSLARAFFYAGARNLLASHWPVSDAVAPILITRTLALERAGIPRAEAFRRAMGEIRMDSSHDTASDSWAHPFYWAPFVLIGDGGQ